MDPHGGHGSANEPTPTIWPVGFAVGIACIFIGLIISKIILVVGAVITAIFGFLWIRDATSGLRASRAARRRGNGAASAPPIRQIAGVPQRRSRVRTRLSASRARSSSRRRRSGSGRLIGVVVTAPVLGFTILPPFIKQGHPEIDVGAIDDFPENKFVTTTYLLNPEQGEVSRRTAYIRNNGLLDNVPSFTVLSNRCVHLGCPVQINGLPLKKSSETHDGLVVDRTPNAAAAGFGCPCHGGQYDTEGNRTAGPPVRALDRYEFRIDNGRLLLGDTFSVSHVSGTGADAQIYAYPLAGPGQHVDGIEAWLYPIQPPR